MYNAYTVLFIYICSRSLLTIYVHTCDFYVASAMEWTEDAHDFEKLQRDVPSGYVKIAVENMAQSK